MSARLHTILDEARAALTPASRMKSPISSIVAWVRFSRKALADLAPMASAAS